MNINEARADLRAQALAARASRQKAGITYNSIQVSIDTALELTEPPTDDEREALAEALYPFFNRADGLDDVVNAEAAIDVVLAAGFRRQGPVTGKAVGEAWVSLYKAGNKDVTVEQVRAALEAAEAAR